MDSAKGSGVRPAALLVVTTTLLLVVSLTAGAHGGGLQSAGTPTSWRQSPAAPSDDGTTELTRTARTRRVAVHDGLYDVLAADKDDALMEALLRAAASGPAVRPPMHKVSLTQIGYIQFLRYMVDVPELRELSFCVWLRSRNLTHNHPIFSYSKNEKERLARAWVSPGGGRMPPRLHFAVMERLVFVEPLPEAAHRRWLHICPSWDGLSGQYRLFVDGRPRRAGVRHEVTGLQLPGGGDVVVGQEYTDFDRGLDDGVEGEVFGFYLFSTATPRGPPPPPPEIELDDDEDQQHQLLRNRRWGDYAASAAAVRRPQSDAQRRRSASSADAAVAASSRPKRQHKVYPGWQGWRHGLYSPPKDFSRAVPARVRRLYALCAEPLALEDREDVIVSWTRSPVRVFGGAILSNVKGGCGDF